MSGSRSAPPVPAWIAAQRTVVLRTRKRDGTWVPTPVSVVVVDDRVYFRTYDAAWKTRRIRNFPDVEFAPSTWRGRPTGDTLRARARLLSEEEARPVVAALSRKYPVLHRVLVPFAHRRRGWRTLHYELTDVHG